MVKRGHVVMLMGVSCLVPGGGGGEEGGGGEGRAGRKCAGFRPWT